MAIIYNWRNENIERDKDRDWRKKHEDCPGRIFGNLECRLSKDYCAEKNCIFEYFGRYKKGTIDALFEI